jgi:hypothetical protein
MGTRMAAIADAADFRGFFLVIGAVRFKGLNWKWERR